MRFVISTTVPADECADRLKAMTWWVPRGPLRCRVKGRRVLAALPLPVKRRLLVPVAVCRFGAVDGWTRVPGPVRPQGLPLVGLILAVLPLTVGWYPTLHAMLPFGFVFAGIFAWALRWEWPSYQRESALLVQQLAAVLDGQVEDP